MTDSNTWPRDPHAPEIETGAELAARAYKVDGNTWTRFADHFFHRCCDCGLSHKAVLRRAGDEHEIRWELHDSLTDASRERHDHPLWRELQRLQQEVVRYENGRIVLTNEIKRLEALVYVPGLWRCPKCEFNLMRVALNVATGTASADDATGEKCPNCQSPLWRVAERDAGNQMADRLEAQRASGLQRARQIIEQQDTYPGHGARDCGLGMADPQRELLNAYRDKLLDMIDEAIGPAAPQGAPG